MKLLFIQGGTRLKTDTEGNHYTDGNLNNIVWDRYKKYCDELIILLRKDNTLYKKQYAKTNFNPLNENNTTLIGLPDLMRPKKNFFNLKIRKETLRKIEKAVKQCDKAIIRSAHNFYTLNAVRFCKKHNKPYLIEIAGFAFDGYWWHGNIFGKIVAVPYELAAKKAVKTANYCSYVTQRSLQNRYPTKGKQLGCSDVHIPKNNPKKKVFKKHKKIILGTIGNLDLKYKGQQDVLKALRLLKKRGIDHFEYQLLGAGTGKNLKELTKKYNIEDKVSFIGQKPHPEVFQWLENIDVYIQPSYTEGLCRAIVEAMSKSCPIISSMAGGNPELTSPQFLFKPGDYHKLAKILSNLSIKNLEEESRRSLLVSAQYDKDTLDKKRDLFYQKFIHSENSKVNNLGNKNE